MGLVNVKEGQGKVATFQNCSHKNLVLTFCFATCLNPRRKNTNARLWLWARWRLAPPSSHPPRPKPAPRRGSVRPSRRHRHRRGDEVHPRQNLGIPTINYGLPRRFCSFLTWFWVDHFKTLVRCEVVLLLDWKQALLVLVLVLVPSQFPPHLSILAHAFCRLLILRSRSLIVEGCPI